MAMTLTLSDGTTSADLFSLSGTFATQWRLGATDHGRETAPIIAEVINVLIQASTSANLQTTVRTIERLLDAAARRAKSGVGARVFLSVQFDGEATGPWRSEVYAGRLELENAPDEWGRLKLTGVLGVSRAPWWEGPETELALTANGYATPATGGRALVNNGVSNWFQAATVEGSLPAPVRVQLTNASGGAVTWREFFWGVNTFGNPTTFGHILQGEDQESGYGTDTGSAEASAGYFNRVSVTTTGAWRNAWLLPTTMTAVGGRWFRLVVRAMVGSATTLKLRAGIYDVGGLNLLWQGQEVTWLGGEELIDLGTAPIPPGYVGSGSGQVMLKLWSEVSTGTYNFDIDYVALLSTDAWRRASTPGMSWGNGDAAVLDEIEGQAYGLSGATRYPYLLGHGGQLVVWPGQTNRFVQLVGNGTQTGSRDQAYSVRAWYRARRSTV